MSDVLRAERFENIQKMVVLVNRSLILPPEIYLGLLAMQNELIYLSQQLDQLKETKP